VLGVSSTPQQVRGVFAGLVSLLASLGRTIRTPFDAILAGLVKAGLCVETVCEILDLTRACLDDHIVRLDLRSPSERPARRRSARGWSVEDERNAVLWRAAGVHPEAIGAHVSPPRSTNAVRAKLRRMGQASPPRKALFRPDSAFFAACPTESVAGLAALPMVPAESCGRVAGPAMVRQPETGIVRPPLIELDPAGHERAIPEKKARAKAARPTEGQREFLFLGVVPKSQPDPSPVSAESEHGRGVVVREQATVEAPRPAAECPLVAVAPIPATPEVVDFADLSWIARVRNPLAHKPTVYAVGMLMMGGLHYQVAAHLTGKSAAAFRTVRTRMGVPIDRDRKKIVKVFDLEVAKATAERGGWIVAQSLRGERQPDGASPLYFWKRKNDRNTHLSPTLRGRDPIFARQSPEMTIITRAVLDAEARVRVPPFAQLPARISAWATRGSHAQPESNRLRTAVRS